MIMFSMGMFLVMVTMSFMFVLVVSMMVLVVKGGGIKIIEVLVLVFWIVVFMVLKIGMDLLNVLFVLLGVIFEIKFVLYFSICLEWNEFVEFVIFW